MNRDVITVGSTMRIPLLYMGEYSQWRERFMNYLEKQTDGEAMINSIQNGLSNEIYSLIDSNETAKDLWDALERQMRGSEYAEQARKAAILYEYETLKATKGEQLLDTYLQWKQYGTLMRQTKNLMDINIDALYNILKQNQCDVNDALGYKKKAVVVTSDPLALVAEKIKDQAWMESSSDSDWEINTNMVFMAQIENVLSDSDESSSSAEESIAEIAKCHKRIEKANQQSKDLENQNKDLQDKYDVLTNQVNTFEEQNNECNEQMKVLNEKNADLLTQTEVLQDQLKSSVSHSKLNKDVKQHSCKDLLSCNKSHLRETSSAYVCNDAMNVSCNSRLCDSFDENNLFIFDDESVRISPVSKMPFRKKPRDSLNVRSKRNSNQSLPRTVHKWLPKMQPLAEPIAKWIPRIVQIYLWIIDSGCSKHMMGNRALLTNFVEKFLGTVRFGNNDFAVIAGYGDVVIRSVTIKKVYYVEGLGHNLFGIGQFCDKGLEVAFRKSTCFVRNKDGVDLLTDDRSSNLYTIALNEVASNSSTCLLGKASSLQSWLWHQRLSHLNFSQSITL
uniref:Integrase, catalytic region, zinc finger, CCHC-type, peptidase aspartic, catalytic n=1 Tax=Tanacetum cinerariifolium TaxID=118510 RepID=A0A6L2K2J3_TANCI|nr:integrase, catalytic region, zinc finger, CCHC-type, peptidase aspartic, catalytic [Tanacetum cinerariifolium]